MPVFIALYRGVNVLGKNSVRMKALCAFHESLGHASVASYIQSGNVVFRAKGSCDEIARKIFAGFAKEFDLSPPVLVRSAEQWTQFIAANPYRKQAAADPTKVHAAICAGKPDARGLSDLLRRTGKREEFAIKPGIVYLYAPDGFGTSKFAAGMELACGIPITFRNWRTMEALQAMAVGQIGKNGRTHSVFPATSVIRLPDERQS